LVWFWADTHFGGAAKSVSRTVVVFVASFDADTLCWVVWISNGARWTSTLVRSRQVFASCSKTAGANRLTFINIDASDLRVARVPRLALTDEAAWQVSTQAVLSASAWSSTLIDINTAGSNILRVIRPAILAHAVGILLLCFAVCMLATCHTLARL